MNIPGSVRSSIGLLQNGQSWSNLNHKEIKPEPPTSNLVNSGIVSFVAAIFFIISFTSPYWLQSYEYTYGTFLNMGLWEFCFNGYRHFDFQYDKMYDGCDHVFSYEFQQIREWLMPGWLMATQSFMSIALVCVLMCLVCMSMILTRIPMKGIMRQEWKLIFFCFWCEAVTAVSIFLSVCIFGSLCWSRDWLLNPNYNYLSWSYIFAVLSGVLHIAASIMMLNETHGARERKLEAANMLQMEPSVYSGPVPINADVQGYI